MMRFAIKQYVTVLVLMFIMSSSRGQVVYLPEIDYKAPLVEVSHDTLTYRVSELQSKTDRSVEDLLSRIPGIVIEESGVIKYNDLPINHFYIDGLDLLGTGYVLASRHIRPEDLQSIQVLERHQPIKVMKNINFSDRAAINIQLKKKRLSHPIGFMGGGIGYGDEIEAKANGYAMLIEKGRQQIVALSHNQSAYDKNNQISSIPLDDENSELPSVLVHTVFDEDLFGKASLPDDRYHDIQKTAADYHGLTSISNGTQIKINSHYDYDVVKYRQRRKSTYSMNDGYWLMDEDNATNQHAHKAQLNLNLERNEDNLYLVHHSSATFVAKDNRYQIEPSISFSDASTTSSYTPNSSITETLSNKQLKYSSYTDFIIKHNKNRYKMHLDVLYAGVPSSRMCYQSDSYQTFSGSTFSLSANSSYIYSFTDAFHVGIAGIYTLRTDGISSLNSSLAENKYAALNSTLSANPYFVYKVANVTLRTEIPLSWLSAYYRDKIKHEKTQYNKPYNGFVSILTWKPTLWSTFDLQFDKSQTMGDVFDFLDAPIRTSYLNEEILGTGELSEQKKYTTRLRYNYRNAMNGTSITASVRYRKEKSNLQKESDVSDGLTQGTTLAMPSSRDIEQATFNATQNFYDQELLIRLNGICGFQQYTTLRNNQSYHIHSVNKLVLVTAEKFFFNRNMRLTLHEQFGQSRNSVRSSDDSSSASSLINSPSAYAYSNGSTTTTWLTRATISYTLKDCWELYASLDMQWRKNSAWQRDEFIDGGIRWFKAKHEIECSLRNLSNTQVWTIHTLNDMDRFDYSYQLRPIEGVLSYRYKF